MRALYENLLSQKYPAGDIPLILFNLKTLGIDQERFIGQLAPTFSILEWDDYDVRREQITFLEKCLPKHKEQLVKFMADYYYGNAVLQDIGALIVQLPLEQRWTLERIHHRRKRSIAKFIYEKNGSSGHLTRCSAKSFSQSAPSSLDNDYRKWPRSFHEMSGLVTDSNDFLEIVRSIIDITLNVRPLSKLINLTVHQVSIFAESEFDGDNSPEGIHQDGSDYIVSALVVERDGILGGESVVFGPDKKTEYFKHTLLPGEGLFQIDKNSPLWHYVTPIRDDPATPPTYGKRSIFGFDIDISN